MTKKFLEGYKKGYRIVHKDGKWVYADTGEGAGFGINERPCLKCGAFSKGGEVAPCLGHLPGVKNACCGHGVRKAAYMEFVNGVTVRGFRLDGEKDDYEEGLDYRERLLEKMVGLLEETADALKGSPKTRRKRSWHDLPEIAGRLLEPCNQLQKKVDQLSGKMCLVCGAKDDTTCPQRDDEYAPCTFDSDPVEAIEKFMKRIRDLDKELKSLKSA